MKKAFTIILICFIAVSSYAQTEDRFVKAGGPFLTVTNNCFPEYLDDNDRLKALIERELEYPTPALARGIRGVVTLIFSFKRG